MTEIPLQGTLSVGSNIIHTSPSGKITKSYYLRFTCAIAFDLKLIKFQNSNSSSSTIYDLSLSAGDLLTDDTLYLLEAGDYLEVITTTAGIDYVTLFIEI